MASENVSNVFTARKTPNTARSARLGSLPPQNAFFGPTAFCIQSSRASYSAARSSSMP